MTLERRNPNRATKPAAVSVLLEREKYYDLSE
jgi:hypothetical protein